MQLQLKKTLFPFLAVLPLTGCVGSAILVDTEEDEPMSAPYPSLHSVPERPPIQDRTHVLENRDALKKSQQKALEQNKALRDKFKL